jgi:cyclohexanecarboxyl-CoA dehydrogenase
MSGFGFTEAQDKFRREVREFGKAEIMPIAKELSKTETARRDVVKKLADNGLLGIAVPEKYGGNESDWVSWGIVAEELGRASHFASLCSMLGALCYFWLGHGSEELREEWIPAVVRGEKLCTWALTESDAGSDAARIRTTAVRDGDYYIVNGTKEPITLGMAVDAAMTVTKTDLEAGAKGVTTFWIPLNLSGVTRTHIIHSGWKPLVAASIFFDNVRVPARYLLGVEGKGFSIGLGAATYARVGLALMGLGTAQITLEETIKHAVQRHAFGQPLAKFEGVSFKIAEHATRIEAARLLCYRTLYLGDQGIRHHKETAMCKWWGPLVAFNAIHDCMLLQGQIGYEERYPLEQRLRDVLGLQFTDGTGEIMKTIIARELMGNVARPY